MENIFTFIKENLSVFFGGFISILLFFLGRYTSYKDDRRKGMKEINECFYLPFITTYDNARRAVALYTSDLPIDVQEELYELLIKHQYCCSPRLRKKIMFFSVTYTGYSENIKAGKKLSDDENEFIDKSFFEIYNIIERKLIKNSRRLYCSLPKRFLYLLSDIFASIKYYIYSAKQNIREKQYDK